MITEEIHEMMLREGVLYLMRFPLENQQYPLRSFQHTQLYAFINDRHPHLKIEAIQGGKPKCAVGSVSFSYAGQWGACFVSRCSNAGIDIQTYDAPVERALPKFLTETEMLLFDVDRASATEVWSMKEAAYKASGTASSLMEFELKEFTSGMGKLTRKAIDFNVKSFTFENLSIAYCVNSANSSTADIIDS